jgi:hypothetical protein
VARKPSARSASVARPGVKAKRVKPNSIADQKARVSGFALDLIKGGTDAEDDNFGTQAACQATSADRPPRGGLSAFGVRHQHRSCRTAAGRADQRRCLTRIRSGFQK